MINRNNYEEYLLLYVDGELSPSERMAVEAFLQENPDLQEELHILQQAVLSPAEMISFPEKSSLYKKAAGIDLRNYQEYFLLYIDNELSQQERQAVETFVLQNPGLQDEFTLLKQTVLPTEQHIFTNKAILYRKEERRRPVVLMMRWASLAAAAVAGVIALVMFNGGEVVDPVAVVPAVQPEKVNPSSSPTETQPGTVELKQTPVAVNEQLAAGDKNAELTSNKTLPASLKTQERQLPEPATLAVDQKDNEARQQLAVISNPPGKPTEPITVDERPVSLPADVKTIANNTTPVEPVYASTVSSTEEAEADKDHLFYVGALQINGDKVRGLFRKATRLLSNKVKGHSDNGAVRVANVEMKKL